MTEYQKAQIRSKYDLVQKALTQHGNSKSKAADSLGLNRKTVYNIIRNYKILEGI
jgi:transcriptional regulator with PAS, ATPase and Fis domain